MDRPVKDESEQHLQLVSLVYEVLRDMKMPADDATDAEVLSLLSQAFFDRATALVEFEAAAPKEHGGEPTFMFSTENSVRMRALRRNDH
jgi:hypothetical protein